MQLQQRLFGLGQGQTQLFPVACIQTDGHAPPQLFAELIDAWQQQLTITQQVIAVSLNQAGMVQQPELILRRRGAALPAGQSESLAGQARTFHLQQSLPLLRCEHEHGAAGLQTQRHQQPQPPAFPLVGCQTQQGPVAPSQAATHQPAEGQVMGPVRFTLPQQCLQVTVGLSFKHR